MKKGLRHGAPRRETGLRGRAGHPDEEGSKRRREVAISEALRTNVNAAIANIRAVLQAGVLPPPVNDKRCDQCSLKEICQPAAVADSAKWRRMAADLYVVNAENLTRG